MGGKRAGAGRPPGSRNRATKEAREAAAASGELPLEYMLRVMRDKKSTRARRDDMAKAAAPYIHPRLQSTTLAGDPTKPLRVTVEDARGKLKKLLG
jgi:hypothetical protein